MPECQKFYMQVRPYMALNTFKYDCLTPLRFKGLKHKNTRSSVTQINRARATLHIAAYCQKCFCNFQVFTRETVHMGAPRIK